MPDAGPAFRVTRRFGHHRPVSRVRTSRLGRIRALFPDTVARRLPQLFIGLTMCGVGIPFMVRSRLGLGPWEVLHQGISRQSGISIGLVSILVGVPVLACWALLRQAPGIGTVSNLVTIGAVTDLSGPFIPLPDHPVSRVVFLATGILLLGVGSGLYIGAGLGPGPRDGLMTGLARRTGRSIRLVRTLMEITVLLAGAALGGTVGIGTVAFALTIGPIVQVALGRFDWDRRARARAEASGNLDVLTGGAAE